MTCTYLNGAIKKIWPRWHRRQVILILLVLLFNSAAFSSARSAPQDSPVHLHGQVRDTSGSSRQAFVTISTFLGPDITQGITTPDGFYAFDVPAKDHYVVSAFPVQRVSLGAVEVPSGFVDRWERINRTAETDLTQDVIVTPGGSILLDAYDPQGNPMFMDNFPEQAFFITYPLGSMPVIDPIQSQNQSRSLLWGWETVAGTLRNPAVLMVPSNGTGPFTVWGLWTVPEAGTLMLDVDNGGLGFSAAAGEAKTINLAYELARTQYRKAITKLDQKERSGYNFSTQITQWLNDAQEALTAAQAYLEAGEGAEAAVSAYQALTPAIRAKEQTALEVAQQDIQKRQLPVTINVVDANHQPMIGVKMDYQETSHDFIISGTWGGSAVPLGDTPETRYFVGNANLYADYARQIGFEYLSNPPWLMWGSIQRGLPEIPYRYDDDVILNKMQSLGFKSFTGALWFAEGFAGNVPPFLFGLPYDQVKSDTEGYISTALSHYAGKIQLYNIFNEPNTANALNFTPGQKLEMIQNVLSAARTSDPQARLLVNLSAPGLGFFGTPPGDISTADFSSYHYLQTMVAAGIQPDAIGLQFYNGAYLPAIDLGTVSDLLDVYGQTFSLPFFITELEYPTHEDYPGLVNISNKWGWHQGQTDQAQADWAVGLYTLAFSKPYILGANWSMAYDLPGDVTGSNVRTGDGYLHRDGLTLRPMAYALSDLFHSWMISGSAPMSTGGQSTFNGFAGNYQVTLTAPNGAIHQEAIHVEEGHGNTFTFVFDSEQALAQNHQDALASLGKARQALAWANNLGKTSGMSQAQAAYSQARSAIDAGQYSTATRLSQQVQEGLAIKVDGDASDWAGVQPLFAQSDEQGQTANSQLRHFYATLDDTSLVMQFQFSTAAPRRDFLFELDTNSDGAIEYSATASLQSGNTLLYSDVYAGQPDLIFTHLIPSIDVIFGQTVEIRIPLEALGNPKKVEVELYRENLGDGSMSGLIPSLGVVTAPPWRINLPVIIKN